MKKVHNVAMNHLMNHLPPRRSAGRAVVTSGSTVPTTPVSGGALGPAWGIATPSTLAYAGFRIFWPVGYTLLQYMKG